MQAQGLLMVFDTRLDVSDIQFCFVLWIKEFAQDSRKIWSAEKNHMADLEPELN